MGLADIFIKGQLPLFSHVKLVPLMVGIGNALKSDVIGSCALESPQILCHFVGSDIRACFQWSFPECYIFPPSATTTTTNLDFQLTQCVFLTCVSSLFSPSIAKLNAL